MADWLPVVSQFKSLVQFICGDEEGAKQTQDNFTKLCPGVSQLRSAVEAFNGDKDAAWETQKACLGNVIDMVNGIPGVGHVKGLVHYACGDKDGGDDAMKAASRTAGVMAGGAVGFAVSGPVGAIAGGNAGGAAMDAITTIVDSNIHGKDRPAGLFKHVASIVIDPQNPGKWFDAGVNLVSDSITGYGAGKMSQKMFKKQKLVEQNRIKQKTHATKHVESSFKKASGVKANKGKIQVNGEKVQVLSDTANPSLGFSEGLAIGVGVGVVGVVGVVGIDIDLSLRPASVRNTSNITINNICLCNCQTDNENKSEKKSIDAKSAKEDEDEEEQKNADMMKK